MPRAMREAFSYLIVLYSLSRLAGFFVEEIEVVHGGELEAGELVGAHEMAHIRT